MHDISRKPTSTGYRPASCDDRNSGISILDNPLSLKISQVFAQRQGTRLLSLHPGKPCDHYNGDSARAGIFYTKTVRRSLLLSRRQLRRLIADCWNLGLMK